MQLQQADPKGLIRESYRIEGIKPEECRSIFMDWALSIPAGTDTQQALRLLISYYDKEANEHPMSKILQQALLSPPEVRRRGGKLGRQRQI